MVKIKIILFCLFFSASTLVVMETSVHAKKGDSFDPLNVPKEMSLYRPLPLIAAQFHVKEGEYTMNAYRTNGAPSLTIDQSRDVLIRGLGYVDGRPIVTISVFNPRLAHTAGTAKPDAAVLSEGHFTVFFSKTDSIVFIEVEVVKGPDKGYKKKFYIDSKKLPFIAPPD